MSSSFCFFNALFSLSGERDNVTFTKLSSFFSFLPIFLVYHEDKMLPSLEKLILSVRPRINPLSLSSNSFVSNISSSSMNKSWISGLSSIFVFSGRSAALLRTSSFLYLFHEKLLCHFHKIWGKCQKIHFTFLSRLLNFFCILNFQLFIFNFFFFQRNFSSCMID